MAKTLKLGDLAKQIQETQQALSAATKVEKVKEDGSTVAVDPQSVKDAIAALKDAEKMLARTCQAGVFGVKVS